MARQQATIELHFAALPPLMEQSKFCEMSGMTPSRLRSAMEHGCLPSVLVGRKRYVNVVRLVKQLDTDAPGE